MRLAILLAPGVLAGPLGLDARSCIDYCKKDKAIVDELRRIPQAVACCESLFPHQTVTQTVTKPRREAQREARSR
jgi:hypothetical protein